MKKILALIMVLGIAGIAKGAISISPRDAAAFANVPLQASQVVGVGIQNDDGSISFIYLGQANIGGQRAFISSDITQFFPDTSTIAGLLIIGLQVRKR